MRQATASVIDNIEILPGFSRPQARTILRTQIMWLRCPEIAKEAKPGQFVMVRCGEECILPRPFSIHLVNNGDEVALLFAVWESGKGTNWLSQRHKGDTVELLGPLGNGFTINLASHNLLLVAGGIGIAPLCFLAHEALKNRKYSLTLLYGTANEKRYPENLLPPEITLVAATEDGTVGHKGMVTDLLSDFADWPDQVFACGPSSMYRDMANHSQRLWEARSVQVSLEVRMGCGLGVCYGCTLRTKRGLKQVCRDGPVFELGDIFWDNPAFNY